MKMRKHTAAGILVLLSLTLIGLVHAEEIKVRLSVPTVF